MSPALRLYALVGAVSLAASVTSLRNGFVYDDVPVVVEDARIRHLSPHLLAVPYWPREDVRDRIYRPLTTFSFAVHWAVGHGKPFVFHLANVMGNAAVCLLVFALLRRLLANGPAALVGALWFAVHPVHVEVVAGVVGRSELLAAFGYLVATLAWFGDGDAVRIDPGGGRRARLTLLTLAGTAIALGGKEHAITLPAALLLADAWTAWQGGERFLSVFRRHALLWAAVVTLVIGYLAARVAVVGTVGTGENIAAGLEGLGAVSRAMVMAPALLVWTRLLAWPVHLSADYSPDAFVPDVVFNLPHVLAAVLLVGVGLAAWGLRRRAPAFAFGVAWFVITVSVTANLVIPTGVMIAERVLYLPSVGAAIAAGALWSLIAESLAPRAARALWPLTALALGLMAARTLTRIPVWRDVDRFYAALAQDAPDSYRTHWATGARAFEHGQTKLGEEEYLRAIQIYPLNGAVSQELGERYVTAQLWAPADRFLSISYRVDSLRVDAAVLATLARLRLGQPDSALHMAQNALRRFPDTPTLLLATADTWTALGQPRRALGFKRRMTFAEPGNWQYAHLAADGAARAGLCEEARRRAERAVALAPDTATAPRLLLGMIKPGPTCGVTS